MPPTNPNPSEGLIHLAVVQVRPVSWLWPGWIPLRKITVVDGDPGLGKSTMLLAWAAGVSRMTKWPEGAWVVDRQVSSGLLCRPPTSSALLIADPNFRNQLVDRQTRARGVGGPPIPLTQLLSFPLPRSP